MTRFKRMVALTLAAVLSAAVVTTTMSACQPIKKNPPPTVEPHQQ